MSPQDVQSRGELCVKYPMPRLEVGESFGPDSDVIVESENFASDYCFESHAKELQRLEEVLIYIVMRLGPVVLDDDYTHEFLVDGKPHRFKAKDDKAATHLDWLWTCVCSLEHVRSGMIELSNLPEFNKILALMDQIIWTVRGAALMSDRETRVWRLGELHLVRAAKGGSATRALTLDQEQIALTIIAEKRKQNSQLSKTAACSRAVAELSKSHGIDVSKDTLLRLLRSRE